MTVDYNSKAYLDKVDAWWRAANYISVSCSNVLER